MTAMTGVDSTDPTVHTLLAGVGGIAINRGLPIPRHEFFPKMGHALGQPFVDKELARLLDQVTPNLLAAGFGLADAPRFKYMMGASMAIREARVLLVDPSSAETLSPLAVTVRLITRCDVHYDDKTPDLVLDVVARRTEGIPGDLKGQRPFLRVTLAEVRVDWSHLFDPSFSNNLSEALCVARSRGETDGTLDAGARDFASKLVDTLAP